jgi:DNA-binding helix-hairpin-helix protein with protein kinase domain
MIVLRRENGSPLKLGRELDAGGEGKIYSIIGEPRLVAKIYHKPAPERTAKLNVMLAHPPNDPTRRQEHISIAWPTERVLDSQNRCVGFLMPYIDMNNSFPLLKLYNPQDRRKTMPGFTWRYLLRTARNFASVLAALHKRGYVVGDLNESNILVTSTALVTLVDCDSIQVQGQHQVFRCGVGKPEYTPPELQGQDFSRIDRSASHDNFGLAVLIFLLLMEGRHPYTGVWQGTGNPLMISQNILAGNCPYLGSHVLTPPKNALPFDTLPPSLQHLMRRSFARNRLWFFRGRPRAQAWFKALRRLEKQLTECNVNNQHIYSNHLDRCPWCERMSSGIPDPFPRLRYATQFPRVPRSTQISGNRIPRYIFPLIIAGVESVIWYLNAHAVNQWFSQATVPLKYAVVLSAVLVPLVVPLILRRRTS